MEAQTNFYEQLGVDIFANQKQIKNAYLKKMKEYHPDKYKGNKKKAEEISANINQAYSVLSNPDQKKKYDEDNGFETQRQNILKQKEEEKRQQEKQKQKFENKNRKKQKKKNAKFAKANIKEQHKIVVEKRKAEHMKEKQQKTQTEREKLLFDIAIVALLIILIVVIIFK